MNKHAENPESWGVLCPKSPGMHTAAAVLAGPPEIVLPATPDGGGPAGRLGRIRDGISIAVASLKALFRDRQMLTFTFFAGLIMLFLVLAEGWSHRYIDPVFPDVILIGDTSFSVSWQYLWVAIPTLDSHFIFYFGLFLIELICLSGLIVVLSALILYRSRGLGRTPFSVREGLASIRGSLGSLAMLSLGMALLATVAFELTFNNIMFSGMIQKVMELFWLPYAYYAPQNWTLGAVYSSALFFSVEIMAINILLFLAALYLVPAIVLEKKGLISAIAGSGTLLKRTWREVLGCVIVFFLIVLGVIAVGILIGQSPALLNHDYDFFISESRGYLPMMIICYGFIVSCWALMAAGFSAAGVALADLYSFAKTGQMPDPVEMESSG
ncbi:MAG: hypothetical protein A4E35_02411 [Methanoregula sp. PtaU1.Bin051]|nr:MAG: hypothetical protein A4E35_02411 [Methanoregula sp. PtaU1.Bin051]